MGAAMGFQGGTGQRPALLQVGGQGAKVDAALAQGQVIVGSAVVVVEVQVKQPLAQGSKPIGLRELATE